MKAVGWKKWILLGFAAIVVVFIVIIYSRFDPSADSFFPPCPSKMVTGIDCPGCGSQRAIHHLLNFEFVAAVRVNALMLLLIPYAAAGIVMESIKSPSPALLKWRSRLFSATAGYILIVVVTVFTIVRNLV